MTLKLQIEVSEDTEGTRSPYWMIIDPRQMMKPSAASVACSMLTGPFFSREEAQSHLMRRGHSFTSRAQVWSLSGCWTQEYDDAYHAALRNSKMAVAAGKWDARFLNLAQTIGSWSKDPSTKVGAVVVRGNRTIASTGYNGFPAGEDDSPELYADREYKYKHVVHAEINALSFLTSDDRKSKDLVLYSSFPVCPQCMRAIGEAGIPRVIQSRFNPEGRDPSWIQEWSTRLKESLDVAAEFGIQVDSY